MVPNSALRHPPIRLLDAGPFPPLLGLFTHTYLSFPPARAAVHLSPSEHTPHHHPHVNTGSNTVLCTMSVFSKYLLTSWSGSSYQAIGNTWLKLEEDI